MKNKHTSDTDHQKQISPADVNKRNELLEMMRNSPIPQEELMNNMALFLDRRLFSRYLFIHELYEKVLNIHGSIFEFGVRYGQNLALFNSLRGILEPFNHNRKIVGFDTWEGFSKLSPSDKSDLWETGDFGVPKNYETYLEQVLAIHEQLAPLGEIKKFELVKGDATETILSYLEQHAETLISLAYFDFDLYEPTKVCLEAILPHLCKGAVIAFDELNVNEWPGETKAFREILGTQYKVYHSRFRANAAYVIFE